MAQEIGAMLEGLLSVYPEFEPTAHSEAQIAQWGVYFEKAKCLNPRFESVSDDNTPCKLSLPLYMLTAHLYAMSGLGADYGIDGGGALVASASVGDVSTSFQAAPYSNSGSPNFDYFYSQTKYGQEYLAWLQSQAGLLYANNGGRLCYR